ncbi:ankyrin repeat domain-containing protein [Devosia sp. ZB163]|uniref:ankyrin repeat domain-containing protein n=1 Tax=Devosia sp. ZB163 TaxID=3025938 RepID=UPI0023621115|nr:ankyrin repeat domain-containing protein [Devosia sp. ZB163]MDC9825890.1 ankyrin repeat domain-containing protein [Devosia sp. ZB163]
MSDPFDLVAKGDLDGLRSALSHDPGLVGTRHTSGASLVAWAAYMGNVGAISAVRAMLRELDPHEAIILRDGARLEAALANGWDANELSADGFTPLSLAAFFDNPEAFDLLLPLTTNVNAAAQNPQKVAALHAACAKRNAAMVEKLLRAGADPNQVQADGFTPLHAAGHHGDGAIAGLLLLAGADSSAKNAKGETAASLARNAGHAWLADRLETRH